jgi:acetoin:2,6-dichlorophenolindophenol oxidoreductase subunit beta
MPTMSFSDATLEAMREEMRRDPTVFLMGEDIAKQGGIFGQFKGLPDEFGFDRVRDTPISEAALVGAGVGAALTGCRPVVDMHFADFITCSMDELVNQAAKLRYMFGEQCTVPMTLRAPDGITKSAGSQHSQALESWFLHTPGLEVVVPADAEDAKGLLKAAIRSDNPTLYFEHKALFPQKGPVPDDEDFVVPIGKAKTMRDGRDVAIVTYGITVGRAMEAAGALEADGIDATVLNLRTVWPLDYDAIVDAVARTHRVIVELMALASQVRHPPWLPGCLARGYRCMTPSQHRRLGCRIQRSCWTHERPCQTDGQRTPSPHYCRFPLSRWAHTSAATWYES